MIAKVGGNFREVVCDDTSEIVTNSLKTGENIDQGEAGQCDLMMLGKDNGKVQFILIYLTQSKC